MNKFLLALLMFSGVAHAQTVFLSPSLATNDTTVREECSTEGYIDLGCYNYMLERQAIDSLGSAQMTTAQKMKALRLMEKEGTDIN